MNEFLKDYKEMVLQPSIKWTKKHWKGYTLFCVGSFIVGCLIPVGVAKIQEKRFEKMYYPKDKTES